MRLEPGEHRLGSDFACEIVLIHPAVAPEHLTLKVDDAAVSILAKPGAPAALFKHALRRVVALGPEEWIPWHLGDRLTIADISFELDGLAPEKTTRPGQIQTLWKTPFPRLPVLAVLLFVALAGLANLSLPRESQDSPTARAAPENEAAPTDVTLMPVVAQPALNDTLVTELLQKLEVKIERVSCKIGDCNATVRVRDTAARQRLQERLKQTGVPLSVDILADEEISNAAELIAGNLGIEAHVLGNENGEVTLSAINDLKLREKLAEILKQDVPGLDSVRFQAASPIDLDAMARRVTGVWPGAYPYVVTEDGSMIRPGDALGQDAKLVAVTGRHLLVEVDGQQKKVVVR